MDLTAINWLTLVASLMVASTPILFAAVGELVVERAGVLNLGVEGMMITGAIAGFAASVWLADVTCWEWLPGWLCSGATSPYAAFVAAALGGAALAALFALLTQVFLSNQVATGLALTLFGTGLAALASDPYEGVRAPQFTPLILPDVLRDMPVLGVAIFRHDPLVYLCLLIVLAVWLVLKYTRAGLVLRAIGESHDAAHALGYNVRRIRTVAILFGGACAGLGGAYLSLIRVPQWTDGVTAGAGWIALAIVVFASWRPGWLVVGAYLFGGLGVLQINLQLGNVPIPVPVLSMTPYIATIAALVILSARKDGAGRAPGSLGQIFHASR